MSDKEQPLEKSMEKFDGMDCRPGFGQGGAIKYVPPHVQERLQKKSGSRGRSRFGRR